MPIISESELERQADELLARAAPDPEYPFYQEASLKREACRHEVPLDAFDPDILLDPGDWFAWRYAAARFRWLNFLLDRAGLTDDEIRVCRLRARGLTYREIGRKCRRSYVWARYIFRAGLTKLGRCVHNYQEHIESDILWCYFQDVFNRPIYRRPRPPRESRRAGPARRPRL
jgi:hypothetical protein